MNNDKIAKPLFKFPGGKRQIMDQLIENLPEKYDNYYECFLGAGSLFWELSQRPMGDIFTISDINKDLVNVYKCVKKDPERIIKGLRHLRTKYNKNRKSTYYSVRKQEPNTDFNRAIRFIFLQKTCFNGVYRLNSSGKYNVPIGDYKNPKIVDEDNLLLCSAILKKRTIKILHQDFDKIIHLAKAKDFIYLDPPYYPLSNTADFVSYTSNGFYQEDFERFVKLCYSLNKKNCKILISNSYSDFIKKSFPSSIWNRFKINVNRSINCDGNNRVNHFEYLIKNY